MNREIGYARARAIADIFTVEKIANLFGISAEEVRNSPAMSCIQSAAKVKVLNELSTTPNPRPFQL